MESILSWFDSLPTILTAAATIVSGCAIFSTVTPTKTDDQVFNFVLKFINTVGFNVGRAKNADDT